MIEQRFQEEDFNGYLNELIDLEMVEDTALGITKKVMHEGVDSLSSKQLYILKTFAVGHNYQESCERCVSEIPWCEMVEALDNGGLCSWCWHMLEKSKSE